MSEISKNFPVATHFGDLNLGNRFLLPARVLENDIRLLTERGLIATFNAKPKSLMQRVYEEGVISEEEWEIACARLPYVENGEQRFGYSTNVLGVMVRGLLSFSKRRKLTKAQQKRMAIITVIRDALVDVAIDALVDECTGYQRLRADDSLQKIFDKYLQKHARKWAKTFPDAFWVKLAKLRGIKKFDIQNRPSYFGHLVNDLIYARLAPHVLEELKRRNPRVPNGDRPNRHHQYFNEADGLPELRDHIKTVMVLMDVFPTNERHFMSALDRVCPKFGSNYELELDIYEEFEGLTKH